MKKILILILLFCFGSKAHAQFPELGWTKEQVEKFMEGKYQYKVDYKPYLSCRYAPILLYGIVGSLWISYDTINKVEIVCWSRSDLGDSTYAGWSDKALWPQINSQLSHIQFLNLADSLTKKLGSPTITRTKDFLSSSELQELKKSKPWAGYKWTVKKQEYRLDLNPHGDVSYWYFNPFNNKNDIR